MNLETLRFPVGKLVDPGAFDPGKIRQFIITIEQFPVQIVKAVGPLTPTQQNWIYRPEGWTIKQVVHHCADSHMNAFVRFKLALTEEQPTIKPYQEDQWAKHMDYEIPVVHSIKIIEGVHYRWVALLKNMSADDFSRTYFHPENENTFTLFNAAAQYDWHCKHHLAHIKQAVRFQGQFEL